MRRLGPRWVLPALFVASLAVSLLVPAAQAAPATYRVQLDARPPVGEPWEFMRFFPRTVTVHQGDVIEAAWGGTDAPHTATMVPSAHPNAWRSANQGPPGPQDPTVYPWALQVPDTAVGGDDVGEILLNPRIAAPTDPTCGTSGNPCVFDGTAVVSSGFMFSDPGSQPTFFVKVIAPVGTYSFLCLLHPGMQEIVHVVAPDQSAPTPAQTTDKAHRQIAHARQVDGPVADAQAQTVMQDALANGHTRWTIWAGGFSNNVSADEFVDDGLQVHVGDRVRVLGNFEIHTATSPFSAAASVPFVLTQCEVIGPDTPATSPADCASPADFQIAFNPKAIQPTESNRLVRPKRFVNSGLLTLGTSFTFRVAAAGEYRLVCLVHGPMMNLTITATG